MQVSPLTTSSHRRLEGVITSVSGPMTAVVRIDRRVAHAKYGKYFTISKKLMIHDAASAAKLGDIVVIEECRPMSRHKRFRYISTLRSRTSA